MERGGGERHGNHFTDWLCHRQYETSDRHERTFKLALKGSTVKYVLLGLLYVRTQDPLSPNNQLLQQKDYSCFCQIPAFDCMVWQRGPRICYALQTVCLTFIFLLWWNLDKLWAFLRIRWLGKGMHMHACVSVRKHESVCESVKIRSLNLPSGHH